jgi:O-antigen ligase/polysaccharide polymerase Wzy-like membrane protein
MAAELATTTTDSTAGTRRLGLGTLEVWLVAVAVTAAIAGTAGAQGGYFPTSWGWTALAFGFVGAIATVLRERIELSRVEIVYLGLVAAFVGWIALSIVWSTGVSGTVDELERALVYATGVLAFLVVARRGQIRVLLGAILVGLVIIAAYALATRLFPGSLFTDKFAGYRLSTPIGYYNGLGLLCAIALLLAVAFVAETKQITTRALAAAAVPGLATTLYFTFSRGAWLALAVALLFIVLVSATRLRLVTTALVLAVPTLIALLLARGSFALTHVGTSLPATQHEGHRLALWLLLLTLASAALGIGLHYAERRPISPSVRRTYATVLLAIAAGAVLVGLVVGHGPVRIAQRGYDRFIAKPESTNDLNQRLFQLSGSWRVDFWRVSWREFKAHPLTGTGAGTYESEWYAHRGDSKQHTTEGHSLYIETLGELGLPGLLLLLGMVLVPFAGIAGRRQPFVAIGLGAYVCLLVHAGTDWDWELPALMLAGTWCGLTALVERRRPGETVELGLGGRGAIVGAATVCAAFAFVGLVGNLAVSSSTSALFDRNYGKAVHQARRAAAWAPWAAEPWSLLAQAELAQHHRAAAVAAQRKAIERQPRDYTLWGTLAAMTVGSAHQQAARRTVELDPGDPSP